MASPRPTSTSWLNGTDNPEINRLLGTEGNLGEMLGLDADWAVQRDQGRRQLRRDLRAQPRRKHAGRSGPRPERPVDKTAACSTRRRSGKTDHGRGQRFPRPFRVSETKNRPRGTGRVRAAREHIRGDGDSHMTTLTDPPKGTFRLSMLIYDSRYRSMTIQIVALIGFLHAVRLADLQHRAEPCRPRQGVQLRLSRPSRAGYDINQRLLDYNNQDSHLRAALRRGAQHAAGRLPGLYRGDDRRGVRRASCGCRRTGSSAG